MMIKKIISLIPLTLLIIGIQAQGTYKFGEGTTCTIKGTSTIHDWTAKASTVSGSIELDKAFAKKSSPKVGATISNASLSVLVKSIDGGKGSTMNDKIYPAFKYESHPNITFTLTSGEVTSVNKAAQTFELSVKGKLSMAGTEKEISFPMKGLKNDAGNFVFDGEKKVDMTTYDIEPPSAMFGQIETGKDVTVIFHLVAKK